MSYYIKPDILRVPIDKLIAADQDITNPTNYLGREDIYIGDATPLSLQAATEEEVTTFYEGVIAFYEALVKKQFKLFQFGSPILGKLKFLDVTQCQDVKRATFNAIYETFPIHFDKDRVEMEYREFAIDDTISQTKKDFKEAFDFWLYVKSLTSPMGETRYEELANLALCLLSIPTSNADSERVFSLVRRIKTDFRSSLSTQSVSSLISCHFNNLGHCCEMTSFDEDLLKQVKSCTSAAMKEGSK